MATLSVRNVGPIREADFEVKKHTVFIGPQGSGKSTLAKLIAIGGDEKVPSFTQWDDFTLKYNIKSFIIPDHSSFIFSDNNNEKLVGCGAGPTPEIGWGFWSKIENTNQWPTSYIPAERALFPILSDTLWSLLSANVNLPDSLIIFGQYFEKSRNDNQQFFIPFLDINYERKNGRDLVFFDLKKSILLAQSASGYQSIIPLLLVVEHQRRQAKRRFIIEEPELNLYPTTQKDLIYNLMSGLDPAVTYQEAEWVITTHSPYVLSSFNTLMLAWKVAQRSDALQAEVEKMIPARSWINPDEFAAYYVDNGTVESIISAETGLINDSRLDDVSEDFAGEQDFLFDLYRSSQPRD
jgi:predicted ATPase